MEVVSSEEFRVISKLLRMSPPEIKRRYNIPDTEKNIEKYLAFKVEEELGNLQKTAGKT